LARLLAGPGGAALLRGDAADELRAVLEALVGVEAAGRAGDPLAEDAGILVNEDAHRVTPWGGACESRPPGRRSAGCSTGTGGCGGQPAPGSRRGRTGPARPRGKWRRESGSSAENRHPSRTGR